MSTLPDTAYKFGCGRYLQGFDIIKKCGNACGKEENVVTLHPQKWVLRWLRAINTLTKSNLTFRLEEVRGSF